MNVKENTIWRHFKGKYYIIEKIEGSIVKYKQLYGDNSSWERNLDDFATEIKNRADNYTGQQVKIKCPMCNNEDDLEFLKIETETEENKQDWSLRIRVKCKCTCIFRFEK